MLPSSLFVPFYLMAVTVSANDDATIVLVVMIFFLMMRMCRRADRAMQNIVDKVFPHFVREEAGEYIGKLGFRV